MVTAHPPGPSSPASGHILSRIQIWYMLCSFFLPLCLFQFLIVYCWFDPVSCSSASALAGSGAPCGCLLGPSEMGRRVVPAFWPAGPSFSGMTSRLGLTEQWPWERRVTAFLLLGWVGEQAAFSLQCCVSGRLSQASLSALASPFTFPLCWEVLFFFFFIRIESWIYHRFCLKRKKRSNFFLDSVGLVNDLEWYSKSWVSLALVRRNPT